MKGNLTTDQKVDLVLEKLTTLDGKVTVLDGKVTVLQKNQKDLIRTIADVALQSGKTADKLEVLAKEVSEIKDEQDSQGKKLDHLTGSFSPFKSGAFVA